MSVLQLSTLVLLALSATNDVHARTDIVEQLYGNMAITKPTLPTTLNRALEELVVSVDNFTNFPHDVQRAMLWSAGWVQAVFDSDSSTSDESSADYVQVYVLCGRTMSDIFQSTQAFDNATVCKLKDCKSNVISYTQSTCDASYVETKTLCALSPNATGSRWRTLQQSKGPMWAKDGQLDGSFNPQIFQFHDPSQDPVTLYLLAQKSSWMMEDNTCPNSAQFIAPCREVAASVVDDSVQERTWCEPNIELGVKLWVAEAFTAMGSGNSDPESSCKASSHVTIMLAVLLGVLIVASIFFFVMWRRGKGWPKDGLHENENNTFFMQTHPYHCEQSQQGNMAGQYLSNKGPHASFEHAAQVEAVNESFRMRSPELAAFCDDQELMLKRIAFAGIVYRERMSSGVNGEIWRGDYEGKQVAIKCTVASVAISAVAALASRRSSILNASALLNDKELKALVDFTKEIRMAAFLDHPNIVRFIGLSWRTLPELCMVSEFVALGDLAQFLTRPDSKHLTWKSGKLAIAADISNAQVYLHSLSPIVLHRDLKSLNILLTENLQAKVSDFGLSRETSFDGTMTSGVGTLLWTAPEVLRGERYSEKADIYSFGVVLAELDTCLPPYAYNQVLKKKSSNGMDWMPLIASGRATPPFRPDCPKAVHKLATQCLDQDPNKRPPAMQIVYLLRSKIPATL